MTSAVRRRGPGAVSNRMKLTQICAMKFGWQGMQTAKRPPLSGAAFDDA
jgi:hypothetical protein